MVRLCLLACVVLAVSLLFQGDLAIASDQVQTNTLIAQDDSGNSQATPDTTAAPDTGSGEDTSNPAQDPE